MKNFALIICLLISSLAFTQRSEMTITVKSIGIDQAEGSNSPYINYLNENGEEMWFLFTLPEVGMQEWAEIKIGEETLIKVDKVYWSEENPAVALIETYSFNTDLASRLIGKKIKIKYTPIDLTNYLYSLEVVQ